MADELYTSYDVLQGDSDEAAKQKAFDQILTSVDSDNVQIKRLAGQMIGQFAGAFPDQSQAVCEKLLALCGDSDAATSRASIMNLSTVATSSEELLVSCVQGQSRILATVDPANARLLRQNILKCFQTNCKAAMGALVEVIVTGEEDARAAAFSLLEKLVKEHGKTLFHPSPELERSLADELKKILTDVTPDEFKAVFRMINGLKIFYGKECGQEIVDMLAEIAGVETEFNPDDVDLFDKFQSCFRQTLPFYSKGGSTSKFLNYVSRSILPKFDKLVSLDTTLAFLKSLAELTNYTVSDVDAALALPALHFVLLQLLPTAPDTSEGLVNPADYVDKYSFSYVECVLYAFRNLVVKNPDFLVDEINADRTTELKARFQFAGQVLQAGYISQLAASVKECGDDKEKRLKLQAALRVANNIQDLIRALYKKVPSAQPPVRLSWKGPKPKKRTAPADAGSKKASKGNAGQKNQKQNQKQGQKQPQNGGGKGKGKKGGRPTGVYSAPAGKYSAGIGSFSEKPQGGNVKKRRRRGKKGGN